MRYVPDLIPDSSKVLPDYFIGDRYAAARAKPVAVTLMWLFSIFFFLLALVAIRHPLLSLLLCLTGFTLTPRGSRFWERQLRFRLTARIKTAVVLALCMASFPLALYYTALDHDAAQVQALFDQKVAKEKEVAEKLKQQRADSFAFYLEQSRLEQKHKPDESSTQLQRAMTFAGTQEEKDKIGKAMVELGATRTTDLVKAGRYQTALPKIDSLLQTDPSNRELLYQRAVCFSKTGNNGKAVNDLKRLMEAGDVAARKLHDKINPLRKRIVGYETLCCDGRTSDARGRGACSHHGGVCDWNHPIYEEYRKYD